MADTAVEYVEQNVDLHNPAFEEVWQNHLFGLPGPTSLSRNLSRDEQYFATVTASYREIEASVDRLHDIAVFMRRFPFADTTVSRSRYLRHNIESYLHEAYILHQRLTSFLPILRRKFRHSPDADLISSSLARADELIHIALDNVLAVRGRHVHENRYSDNDLARLDTLELLTQNADMTQLAEFYITEYKRIRQTWVKTVGDTITVLDLMLDGYFNLLATFMISNERLTYPPAPRRE
jgi:hypothetical protein